jgi:hypothetical protein
MTKSRLIAVLTLSAVMSACGGNDTKVTDCEEGVKYQNRAEGRRVVVPEGLDPLDEFAEMPIPRADPDAAQPAPGKCADTPPIVT